MNKIVKIDGSTNKLPLEDVRTYPTSITAWTYKNGKREKYKIPTEIAYIPTEKVFGLIEADYGINFHIFDITPKECFFLHSSDGRNYVNIRLRFVYYVDDKDATTNEEKQRFIELWGSSEVIDKQDGLQAAINTAYTTIFKTLEKIFNKYPSVYEKNNELKAKVEEIKSEHDSGEVDTIASIKSGITL